MIDKKEPHQKIVDDDFSDDDPIIELTDEVVIEPGEDRRPATRGGQPTNSDDQRMDTAEKFGQDSHEDDEIVLMEDRPDDDMDDNLTAILEDDAITMTGDDRANDFNEDAELEYEGDEDELDFSTLDNHADEDVIAGPSAQPPLFDGNEEEIDLQLDEGEDDTYSSETRQESSDVFDLLPEENQNFDDDEDLSDLIEESFPMSDENSVAESEGNVISLADFDDDDAEIEEEIIEITEFDQHFPEDVEEIAGGAGVLNPSDLGDEDFLEIFEIEDEELMEDDEMRQLGDSEEKAVEAELSRLLDDTLEDEVITETNAEKPAKESAAPDPEWAETASALSSEAPRSNLAGKLFSEDTGTGSGNVLSSENQSQEDDRLRRDLAGSTKGEIQSISPKQIDLAIERVIKEKFADRIEQIICDIIEKAVSKEIERLKKALLEDGSPDDDL